MPEKSAQQFQMCERVEIPPPGPEWHVSWHPDTRGIVIRSYPGSQNLVRITVGDEINDAVVPINALRQALNEIEAPND